MIQGNSLVYSYPEVVDDNGDDYVIEGRFQDNANSFTTVGKF